MHDLSPRIQQLRQQQTQLNIAKQQLEQELSERRIELVDEATVSAFVKDLRDLLTETSLTEQKSFIRSFVKEIRVTGDRVLLTYTIPMSSKKVTEEQIPVLSIVQDGSAYRIRTGDLVLERDAS